VLVAGRWLARSGRRGGLGRLPRICWCPFRA